jgi:SEC-C motif-containing protein
MPCPCGLSDDYESCCGRYHRSTALPPTAEALMRSRYSAFAKHEIEYLQETTWPANRRPVDNEAYRTRAESSIWLGLTVHETENGLENDNRGTVTFTARFMVNGQFQEQSEKSMFRRKNGRWFYVKPVG